MTSILKISTLNEQRVRHHAFFVYTCPIGCWSDYKKTNQQNEKNVYLFFTIIVVAIMTSCGGKKNQDNLVVYSDLYK